MMTTKSRLLTKVSCGLSLAFLALATASNISTVRADTDVPSWMMVDPISTTVNALEERLTSLEAKVALVAESLVSRQSTEHELCVADDAGARTCLSKAQIDQLLKMIQTAAVEQPAKITDKITDRITASVAETVTEPAKVESTVESKIESTVEASEAPETQAAVFAEPAQIETTSAAVVEAPHQAEQAALPEDTINPDSMPTGSVPAPTQGDALVIQPEVEVSTPSTEQ
jgi:polyhydroxyalkanoate synthesis regulator phasin